MKSKALLLSCSGLLIAVAGYAWFSYVAQGIAYGAILGLKGRGADIAFLKLHVLRALGTALGCEGLAVGLGSWVLLAKSSEVWLRLLMAVALGGVADFFTYAIIKP